MVQLLVSWPLNNKNKNHLKLKVLSLYYYKGVIGLCFLYFRGGNKMLINSFGIKNEKISSKHLFYNRVQK